MAQLAPVAEMQSSFVEVLELCGVNSNEKVAVLSEGRLAQEYSAAFIAAAAALGAEPLRVNVAATGNAGAEARIAELGRSALSTDPAAMQSLKGADLVIDLMLLLFSREQIEIQKAGARVLMVVEPFEVLQRLMPKPSMRARVEAAERRMQGAKTLRFTNDAGTDLRYELKVLNGPPPECILTEYGYTDTPGRWDHWPSGFLASTGTATGVEGTVVMDADDIVLPWKEFLKTPVEFKISGGKVTDINGEEDARRLRDYIEGFADPRAYAVSHIGWGLNEDALWEVDLPGIAMDSRAYEGNVLFSLGPDTEFGGDNDTPCHLDLPMKNCSLWLDDELIVSRGEIVPEDMRAPGH
ncbi:MAG: leucyl aminopeptidase [Proteobacteria bacterium]|nr:leucyl aminopeptidase [Pseudomonadota bacterium]